MHFLTIHRTVIALAGGTHNGEKQGNGCIIIEVAAGLNDKDWQIIKSPFMQNYACTWKYRQRIIVGSGKLLTSHIF